MDLETEDEGSESGEFTVNETFKVTILDAMKDISYFLDKASKKVNNLSSQLKKCDNIKNSELIGVKLINIFSATIKNISFVNNNLESEVKKLNDDLKQVGVLTKFFESLQQFRTTFNIVHDGEVLNNNSIKSEIKNNIPVISEEIQPSSSLNSKKVNLSLKRNFTTNTEETVDEWENNIERTLAVYREVDEIKKKKYETVDLYIEGENFSEVDTVPEDDFVDRANSVKDGDANKNDDDDFFIAKVEDTTGLHQKNRDDSNLVDTKETFVDDATIKTQGESDRSIQNSQVAGPVLDQITEKCDKTLQRNLGDLNQNKDTPEINLDKHEESKQDEPLFVDSDATFVDCEPIKQDLDDDNNHLTEGRLRNRITEESDKTLNKSLESTGDYEFVGASIMDTIDNEENVDTDIGAKEMKDNGIFSGSEKSLDLLARDPLNAEPGAKLVNSKDDTTNLLTSVEEDIDKNNFLCLMGLAPAPETPIINSINKLFNDENDNGDLLDILKEVDLSEDELVLDEENDQVEEETKTVPKVNTDDIFNRLMEANSPSESSETESIDLSSDAIFNSDSDELMDVLAIVDEKEDTERFGREIIEEENDMKKHSSTELVIKLVDYVKYNYKYDDVRKKKNVSTGDEIDRLCNLSGILKRRTHSNENSSSPKKKKRTVLDTSVEEDADVTSNSGHNSSDSESTVPDINITTPVGESTEEVDTAKEDYLLSLCNNIQDTSDCSTDKDVAVDDSDNESKKSEEIGKTEDAKVEVKEEIKTEPNETKLARSSAKRTKKLWWDDPLLRGKLSSDSDSSTSDGTRYVRRKKTVSKYEKDDDFKIESEFSSKSESGRSTIPPQTDKIENKNDSFFHYDLSDDTDDSDVILIQNNNDDKAVCLSSEDEDQVPNKTGRRNIRALLSQENLAASTQQANLEEQARIARLKEIEKKRDSLWDSMTNDPADLLVLDPKEPMIKVHPKITNRLKEHQKQGVLFMWHACYESVERLKEHEGSGCILAHCMGLGKTFQVIALIHTLFSYKITNTKHVLIVCPLSTVSNWRQEFKMALQNVEKRPPFRIHKIFNKSESNRRITIIQAWRQHGGVLILGYELFECLTNANKIERLDERIRNLILEALIDPGPNLVVCDEGHLLRNKNSLKTLALNRIRTRRRIALTGTPLQNNLAEYYQMVQFVKPNLLGTLSEFRINFQHPITNGQYGDSTPQDIKLMKNRTHVLHKILNKTVQRYEVSELEQYLPKLIDYALFIKLHSIQIKMYEEYIKMVKSEDKCGADLGFLNDYSIIKLICSHPFLFNCFEKRNKSGKTKIKEKDVIEPILDENIKTRGNWWKKFMPEDVDQKIEYGSKLYTMKLIIEECENIGDKMLIFSQSLSELDCIEHFLQKIGTQKCPEWKRKTDYIRMDGTVAPELRSGMCDDFNDNNNKKLRLFLMSYRVGSLGLNLTAANRVILMNVNFNPSYDTQSMYRAYRFGQTKQVVIYRLIAQGTMEEKIYQRSVTKLAISSRVVDRHQIQRHYKYVELKEMYTYDFENSPSSVLKVPEDKMLALVLIKTDLICKYHEHQGLLQNRPDESLNEQEKNAAWEEFIGLNQPSTSTTGWGGLPIEQASTAVTKSSGAKSNEKSTNSKDQLQRIEMVDNAIVNKKDESNVTNVQFEDLEINLTKHVGLEDIQDTIMVDDLDDDSDTNIEKEHPISGTSSIDNPEPEDTVPDAIIVDDAEDASMPVTAEDNYNNLVSNSTEILLEMKKKFESIMARDDDDSSVEEIINSEDPKLLKALLEKGVSLQKKNKSYDPEDIVTID